jgi:segregation and condensation protein A
LFHRILRVSSLPSLKESKGDNCFMAVSIKLPVFEGPLDLLLHLVKANKVKIWDISIAQIAQQYLEYLQWMQSLDMNIAGEFLVMATTLMEIKSRMLLPRPTPGEEEPEDPRERFIHQLILYQQFRKAAEWLGEQEVQSWHTFPRGGSLEEDLDPPPLRVPKDALQVLVKAFRELFRELPASITEVQVRRYRITLRQQMARVYDLLQRAPGGLPFLYLFEPEASRREVVITFLAILELLRQQKIQILSESPLSLGVCPAPLARRCPLGGI